MAEAGISVKELQERLELLEELLEINLFLNSTLDLDTLLRLILETSQQLLKADAASILLLDKKTGELFFRKAVGAEAVSKVEPYRLAPGEGIAGSVIKERRPVLLDDAPSDPRFAKRFDKVSGFATKTMLAVPLRAKEEVIGVLEFLNKEGASGYPERFSTDDVQKGTVLASMAAVALENARLYQELSQSYEKIRKAEESKEEFISVISHELRTPLVPIQGYAFLLRKQGEKFDEKNKEEFLDEILRQSDHLKLLIEDLFLVNEFEKPLFLRNRTPVLFEKLVLEALRIKKVRKDQHPVKLEISSLPEGKSPTLFVDQERFTHLLVHLLDNAVKFSEPGGLITFTLGASKDGEVVLSVLDEGIGIPEAFREKIFDRFFQIDSSSTRRFGGTGVGLYIVKKIAEGHGGRVSCESNGEKGCRILIHLPPAILG